MFKTEKFKNTLFLLIVFGIIVSGMILPYIFTNTPFEYGGDLKPSGFAFYEELKNLFSVKKLLHGVFPFYSWNLFLGTNFWASKTFYVVGDIYNYLTMFIPTHFYNIVEFLTVLRLLIASILFFVYLRLFNKNTVANIIGAMSFAFSAWVLFFLGQMSFVSFFSLLPLYFIGIELYLRSGKKLVYIFATAILLFTNYYFFFSLSVFTPMYYIYRYYNHFGNFKGFIRKTLVLIGYYLIGVMITGIISIPTVYYMLDNDRVGNMSFMLIYDYIKINMHILVSTFVPSQTYIYQNNIFETGGHTTREITLWAGTLTGLLVPQFLSDRDKKYRNSTVFLYIVLIAILFSPLGGSIMHGFSESSFRWTVLLTMMNLLTAQRYLSDLTSINLKNLHVSLTSIILIVVFSIPITLWSLGQIDVLWSEYAVQFSLFMACALIFVIFYFILKSNYRHRLYILLILTMLELFSYSAYLIGYSRRITLDSWDAIKAATSVLQDRPNELNEYLLSLDEENKNEFYRVFVPHTSLYWNYSHNQSIQYQLKGLMTYDSTYAPSFNDMKSIAPQVKDFGSDWIFNIKDPYLVDFLNTKYAIVVDPSELPHENFKLITDSYRGSLLVYENLNYRPLITSYTSVMSYEKFKSAYDNNLDLLDQSVIAHEEDLDQIQALMNSDATQANLVRVETYDNQLIATITSTSRNFVVLTLPYDKGWKLKINGQELGYFKVNGGFMGFAIPEGESYLEMYFTPVGFKQGAILTIAGSTILLIMIIKEIIKREKKG